MNRVGKTISFDSMLDALADIQRRTLLVAILKHNPQDGAPVVLADSNSESDAVERPITMQHIHLPKLADSGFIEWNEKTHEVMKGPNFDEIRPLLELLENHDDELSADWLYPITVLSVHCIDGSEPPESEWTPCKIRAPLSARLQNPLTD